MKKRLAFMVLTITVLVLMSGCDPIRRTSIEDTQKIPEDSGVIVARVILNEQNNGASGPVVALSAKRDSVTGMAPGELIVNPKQGQNIYVMTLPIGKYNWVEFWVQGKKSDFEGHLPFNVEAGKIAYIGDVVLSINENDPWHYRMHLTSDLSAVAGYMNRNYPKLMARYPLVKNLTVDNR